MSMRHPNRSDSTAPATGQSTQEDTVPRGVRAGDLMSTPVFAVTPEVTVERAGEVMRDNGFTTLPVVDQHGRLCGLVTEEALACVYLARLAAYDTDAADGVLATHSTATVRGIMLPPVSLELHTELIVVVETLLQAGLRSVPVVRDDRPIGIVSWRDALPVLSGLPNP